jgi:hypothetical protein
MRKKRLNIPQERMVPSNYGGNLSEAKRADLDVKIGCHFSIVSYNSFLQQIGNFVVTLAYWLELAPIGQVPGLDKFRRP